MTIVDSERKNYPFPPRDGEGMERWLDTLNQPPEYELNDEQLREVQAFERPLTEGLEIDGEKIPGLYDVWKIKVETTDFWVDYFLTPEGKSELKALVGEQDIDWSNVEEISKVLHGINYSGLSDDQKKQYKDLSGKKSYQFAEDMIVKQWMEQGTSIEDIKNPRMVTVIDEPDKLVEKVKLARELKRHHRDLAKSLKVEDQSDQALLESKQVVLALHRRRLNEIIADLYPSSFLLRERDELMGDSHNMEMLEVTDSMGLKVSRLDKFLHGIGEKGDLGNYSQISKLALELADQSERDLNGEGPAHIGRFSNYSMEELSQLTVPAETLWQWAVIGLQAYDLLSNENLGIESNNLERASDGKYKVVIDNSKKNFSRDPKKRLIVMPDKQRKFISVNPAGAGPLIGHEITHALQDANSVQLASTLSIFREIGGDRSITYKEAGAKAVEAQMQRELFGIEIPEANPHYLRAAVARLEGNDFIHCVSAFYESYRRFEPNTAMDDAVRLSINRTTRLFRKGGALGIDRLSKSDNILWNSQSLSYLEQALLSQNMSGDLQKWLMVGGTNIQTLAELHRVGLLSKMEVTLPDESPTDVLYESIKTFVDENVSTR